MTIFHFFPCLFFVLSFIFILLILLHRVFLRNKTIPRCFVFLFVFGCCTLNIFWPLFLLSWCHDLKTRCDPKRHIESNYIFDLSISMFCDRSCPRLLKFRTIPHVPRNICTTYQFVSTKYSRNKTDMRVNLHHEIAVLRYNTLKKLQIQWAKNN